MKKLWIILCFSLVFFHFYDTYQTKYNKFTSVVDGTIVDIKKNENYIYTVKGKEKVLVFTNKKYKLGDYISIEGTLMLPKENTIFNLFNYQNYLLSKKIFWTMESDNITLLKENSNILYKIKNYLSSNINNRYIKAFILGDKTDIDSLVTDSFKENGISHLFSISGMHISLFSGLILFILNKINKRKRINYIIVIIFLLLYMFLTNYTTSIIRSTFMFILLFLNKELKLNISTIYILLIIFISSLLYNPYYVFDIGFWFTHIISFYLILFNNLYKNKNYFLKLLIISFISFLASIPILINTYFEINLFSIIYNLLFVPLISFIIFPLSLITFILPFLEPVLLFITNIFEQISLFLSNINLMIILPKVPIYILIIYYLLITYTLYRIGLKKYYGIIILTIFIFIHSNYNYLKKESYLTMFDVKQGDSFLIHFPYNKSNILIDTGGSYYYTYSKDIVLYLKSKGIKKLDYLVLTHGDYDHMGESVNLINNYKIKNVIFNNGSYNNVELELITVLNTKKINYYKGINKIILDGYSLEVLDTKISDNENDNSIVIYLDYDGTKILLMGDVGIEVEEDLIKNYDLTNIDILKIGHHGSDTSSSKMFINKTNPKTCLISVGANNRYGHPKNEVIDLIANYCDIYRTDQNGSIEIRLNNNNYEIKMIKG